MKKNNWRRIILIIIITVFFALIMRYLFGVDSWQSVYSVMTISFIFLLPVGVGALTIALSPLHLAKKRTYQIFAPWIPIFLFLLVTVLFKLEGIACWVIVFPLFIIAASIGGLIVGIFKIKKAKQQNLYVSLILILPLITSPIEKSIEISPTQYEAYTFIDINSVPDKIWSNVTRVKQINPNEDKGHITHLLGIPRPIKAELNYEGIGAYRKAIFDKGLAFHETVTQYEQEKLMSFSIKAYPYEIPSTTMDNHIVVGGDFFDVLNGTYRLEKVTNGTYRLHLYSHFELKTNFNFYASLWVRWIMKDIQGSILQVIKQRSERT